jgi:hypothetical protein
MKTGILFNSGTSQLLPKALCRLYNLMRYIRLTLRRCKEFVAITIGGDLSEFDGFELVQIN